MKYRIRMPYIMCAIAAAALIWMNPARIYAGENGDEKIYQYMKLLSEVYILVRDNYIEPQDEEKIIYGAAKGMTDVLDTFSAFMVPEVNKMMKTEAEGSFGGLGIKIGIRDGLLTVITPMPGTPAYEAGIFPGDQIVKIEGRDTKGFTLDQAVQLMRGKVGTKVSISVLREGEKELIDFTLTRAEIILESVPEPELFDDGIGYIRITEFSEKTPGYFENAWKKLTEQNVRSLILDLRYNPGGLLSSAFECTRMLIGGQKLIVFTSGRVQEQNKKFYAQREALIKDEIPLVVLVNKGTASGSEILAGAVKDWKRGIILGETTFGKGSVQSLYQLSDGSGLKLTTAKYYTPSGNSIHEKGIEPDIEVIVEPKVMAQIMRSREKIYRRRKTRTPGKKDEAQEVEEKEEEVVDIQIERAKEILRAQDIFRQMKAEAYR